MTQDTDVGSKQASVQSRFTPLIDLNNSSTTELAVKDAFALAEKNVDKDFYSKAELFLDKKVSSKKMQFGVFVIGVAVLGFLVLQIAGALAASGAALVGTFCLWYFWQYKLPKIIQTARSELMVFAKAAALKEKEKLRQIEIDHLEKLKASAEKNPIETLEIELGTMESEREALGKANTIVGAQFNMLDSELNKSIKENPGADFTNEKKELANLKAMCEADEAEFSMFVAAVEEMKKVLKEARSHWNFALKLDSAFTQRDKARGNETQRKILADTALDTIKRKNAELFSRVRTRAVQLSAANTIKVGGHEIDVSSVKLETPPQQSQNKG